MSVCGIQHRPTGLYCTLEWEHKGAHIATDMKNTVLASWTRRKPKHSEPSYIVEAEHQRGLRTFAKPITIDGKDYKL
jgi:hypothetical protein